MNFPNHLVETYLFSDVAIKTILIITSAHSIKTFLMISSTIIFYFSAKCISAAASQPYYLYSVPTTQTHWSLLSIHVNLLYYLIKYDLTEMVNQNAFHLVFIRTHRHFASFATIAINNPRHRRGREGKKNFRGK